MLQVAPFARQEMPRTPADARVIAELRRLRRTVYMQTLVSDDPPTTDFGTLLTGPQIDENAALTTPVWVKIHENDTERIVRVTLSAYWGQPDDGIRISKTRSEGKGDILDIMANAAGYLKTRSRPFLLMPRESLLVAKWQGGLVQMSAATWVRAEIFDPLSLESLLDRVLGDR